MTNPEDNGASVASGNRHAFGYTLKLMLIFMFMFISCIIMNIFMFTICLNMNTRTCFVSLTIIVSLLKYLFDCGIKIYRNIVYHLTIQKPYIVDRMMPVATFANSIKAKPFDGSNFKR